MEEIKKASESFFNDFMKLQIKLETISKNSQGFNYKYADLPRVWNSIKKIVSDNGFIVSHEIGSAGVRTDVIHISGNKLTSFIPWSGQVKPQDRGSEITYYKRYNIMAIFNVIVEGEDDDGKKANDTVKVSQELTPACSICGELMVKGQWGWWCKNRDKGKPVYPETPKTKNENDFLNSLDEEITIKG